MKIPGWTYLVIGIFMALYSGYIYKFVPKPDGTPNISMAVFFFIAIIFIIVGIIRIFFNKIDESQEKDFNKINSELEKTKHLSTLENHRRNRVEEQINKTYKENIVEKKNASHQINHSSEYAKTHPYHNIQDTTEQNSSQHQLNKQHFSQNHNSPYNPYTESSQPRATSTISITTCKRCGNKNSLNTNYCHECGNRLR